MSADPMPAPRAGAGAGAPNAVGYAWAARIAAQSFAKKAHWNRAVPRALFEDTDRPLWEVQSEIAAALTALAELLERLVEAEAEESRAASHHDPHAAASMRCFADNEYREVGALIAWGYHPIPEPEPQG